MVMAGGQIQAVVMAGGKGSRCLSALNSCYFSANPLVFGQPRLRDPNILYVTGTGSDFFVLLKLELYPKLQLMPKNNFSFFQLQLQLPINLKIRALVWQIKFKNIFLLIQTVRTKHLK